MTTPNNDLRATPATDGIRSLVQRAAGSSGHAGAAPVSASVRAKSDDRGVLQRAIRSATSSETRAARSGTPNSGHSQTAITLALGHLLLGLGVWKASQPALTGSAAALHALAQSIEQYRLQRNGSLPEQLSKLESFPKDAVQWQLQHRQARDAAGRTEIFLAPNGTQHYRLVLRQGTEVRVDSDLDGKAKQTIK